jgi:hypothetical protein
VVKEGIVFGHKITGKGIEADKANIEAIERLPLLEILKVYEVSLVMQAFIEVLLRTYIKSQDL